MQFLTDLWRRRPVLAVASVVAVVVVLRLAVAVLTPFELAPDEAQYWRWSRTLDFGYYSKPPLIAWVIALTTSIFGDVEWAIRLSPAILHGGAAMALYALARIQFEPRVGAWAAAIYLLMPGVFLSSTIMSTDAVLLPLWALSLLLLWKLREAPGLLAGLMFGLAVGLAMLAKYAALYLLVGAALAAVIDPPTRRALLSWNGAAALAGLALMLAPNLYWNYAHDFATIGHTADNADWQNTDFSLLGALDFLVDQMGVFGPIMMIVLLAGGALIAGRGADRDKATREMWLACFIIPPLVVILGQSIIARAHANWAATAYPAACVLAASWIVRARWRTWIVAGVALNLAVGALYTVSAVAPAIADAVGAGNTMKRVRGWKEMTEKIAIAARQHNASVVLLDEREPWHEVDYYGRNLDMPPIRCWQFGEAPHSHAEEAGALRPGEDTRVLVAAEKSDYRPRIRGDFKTMERVGEFVVQLDAKRTRKVVMYIASGYQPAPRGPAWSERYRGAKEE